MRLDLPLERVNTPLGIAVRCEAVYQYWCTNNLELMFHDRLPTRLAWLYGNAARLTRDYGIPEVKA